MTLGLGEVPAKRFVDGGDKFRTWWSFDPPHRSTPSSGASGTATRSSFSRLHNGKGSTEPTASDDSVAGHDQKAVDAHAAGNRILPTLRAAEATVMPNCASGSSEKSVCKAVVNRADASGRWWDEDPHVLGPAVVGVRVLRVGLV